MIDIKYIIYIYIYWYIYNIYIYIYYIYYIHLTSSCHNRDVPHPQFEVDHET